MDLLQLIEDLDHVNNNDLDSYPLSMTSIGDALLDMAESGGQFQPQPPQALLRESSLPESVLVKNPYHEEPDALQGQLKETCSEWEDQNSDSLQEILEVLQQLTDNNPTADVEENDPHKASCIQKILEQMLAGAEHLLPAPAQPQLQIPFAPPSHLTPPLHIAETKYSHVPSVPMFSDQDQNMTEHTGHVADILLKNWVPDVEIKNRQSVSCDGPLGDFTRALESSVLSLNGHTTKKSLRSNQTKAEKPYIKKPPNAFMVYRQEQRAKITAEFNISDSALVNTELGLRWKCMSKQDKLKYFQEADRLKCLHAQQNPDWSSSDNYGKKKKRIKRNY